MSEDSFLAPQNQGGICVAVALPDSQHVIDAIRPLEEDIDVIEVRLDAMKEIDIPYLCQEIHRPLLFTNRAEWEGGEWTSTEEERLKLLLQAVQLNAAFVDLELRTAIEYREQLLAEIHGSETQLIISYHDFEGTPDATELSAILQEQINSGAHIGKIVTMARSSLDVLRVLNLQVEARIHDFPLIAFCMGDIGRLSRIVTLPLGGFMTYAALDEKQATAPGQLTVQQLKDAMTVLTA